MLPPDIDPESRCRLPRVKREDLDPDRQARYDKAVDPKGGTIRGLAGPAGIHLHSKRLSIVGDPLGKYLRFDAGFSPRVREVAILISARMSNSRFEWAAHEPQGLKDGVPPETIDVIKHRKALDGIDPVDAIIIQLGREIFGDRKVKPETFARAHKHFGSGGLVDLVALMGNYASTAALLCAFDMQLDDGTTALLPVD